VRGEQQHRGHAGPRQHPRESHLCNTGGFEPGGDDTLCKRLLLTLWPLPRRPYAARNWSHCATLAAGVLTCAQPPGEVGGSLVLLRRVIFVVLSCCPHRLD
jgi:hypothetical protein